MQNKTKKIRMSENRKEEKHNNHRKNKQKYTYKKPHRRLPLNSKVCIIVSPLTTTSVPA
jgi:hypothetical protein